MSVPLKRDAYVKLPPHTHTRVEKDNVDRKLLKPLYVLSTACKDWYKTIRHFLATQRGVKLRP